MATYHAKYCLIPTNLQKMITIINNCGILFKGYQKEISQIMVNTNFLIVVDINFALKNSDIDSCLGKII